MQKKQQQITNNSLAPSAPHLQNFLRRLRRQMSMFIGYGILPSMKSICVNLLFRPRNGDNNNNNNNYGYFLKN